jgi:hypothetical protein
MSHALPRPRANHPFLRRNAHTLQIGLQRQTAVSLDGVSDDIIRALVRLDGSVPRGQLTSALPELDEVLNTLERLGLIEDSLTNESSLSHLRRQRLEHEHNVLSVAHGSARTAEEILVRRANAVVGIRGSDRAAAHMAVGLACAGIGTVAILGPDHLVSTAEITPVGPFEPEFSWVEQISEAVRRQGSHASLALSQRLDVVVICHAADVQPPWTDPELADDLMADDIPHYPVAVSGLNGRIGPLVIPGRTACLGCIDRSETDRDRAWPALIDQVRTRHHQTRAQDSSITSLCTAAAVQEILIHLDQREKPLNPPEGNGYRLFRDFDPIPTLVPVAPHPLCGCGWGHLPHTMEV